MPKTYRSTLRARRELFDVAALQGGYFTAKEAAAAGYRKQHLDYHTRAGNFERIDRGLYRLSNLLISQHDDLIRWSLWSRRRDDQPQAVVSHETALRIHDLGDVLPEAVHLTVPPSFKKRPRRGLILHRAYLSENDLELHQGFRVTSPLRTLFDLAVSPLPSNQLAVSLRDAIRRGLVRRRQIESVNHGDPGRKVLLDLL